MRFPQMRHEFGGGQVAGLYSLLDHTVDNRHKRRCFPVAKAAMNGQETIRPLDETGGGGFHCLRSGAVSGGDLVKGYPPFVVL